MVVVESPRERGQGLVEFALLLPVLMFLLLGALDLGRAWTAYVVMTNAAREGAYYGSMYPAAVDVIKYRTVTEAQGSGIPITASNVTVSGSGALGTTLRVTVLYNFPLVSTALFGVSTVPVQTSAAMMVVRID